VGIVILCHRSCAVFREKTPNPPLSNSGSGLATTILPGRALRPGRT
jgi:hypothetical protein